DAEVEPLTRKPVSVRILVEQLHRVIRRPVGRLIAERVGLDAVPPLRRVWAELVGPGRIANRTVDGRDVAEGEAGDRAQVEEVSVPAVGPGAAAQVAAHAERE